ncbi:hypothetical protein HY792_03920 [Candidatus Desantisbacteria bacterium]|nr:hypothetical protein [Candidatus Desantisbacteria bacterium]
MAISLKKIAEELFINRNELIRQGIISLLKEQLCICNTERLALCNKFGVSSLEEMDKLVIEGNVEEDDILDDFQRVDFLTSNVKKIKKLLIYRRVLQKENIIFFLT